MDPRTRTVFVTKKGAIMREFMRDFSFSETAESAIGFLLLAAIVVFAFV